MDDNLLSWLQQWYTSHCDGDWKHQYGMRMATLDNPGWVVRVNLIGTELEEMEFPSIKNEKSEHDWVHCHIENGQFVGHCGPLNLVELLGMFRSWAESAKS